jgi:hypothetical protein
MRIRNGHDGTEVVHDTTEDRDLIAMVNEARDSFEIDRITLIARARSRARQRDATAAAAELPKPRRARSLASALGFLH